MKPEGNMTNKVINGDCLELFKQIEDNSIDSVVTDSPYGLGFMNKAWDTFDKSQFGLKGNEGENDLKVKKNFNVLPRYNNSKGLYDFVLQWSSECYRVLKPGGYILSFGGTRTYHRMACAIEDAGFELRDMIMWIYGSGFPKSLNVGKAIDKLQGNEREIIGTEDIGHDMRSGNYKTSKGTRVIADITKGNSEWEGYGTALKPAVEPICVARKPISEKTIADNVLKHGTGAINIDGCRIALNGEQQPILSNHSRSKESAKSKGKFGDSKEQETHQTEGQKLGRFPANIIFDEEAGQVLDEQTGVKKSGIAIKHNSGGKNIFTDIKKPQADDIGYGDKGGASRFFYCAKVSKSERNKGLNGFEEKAIEIQQPHNSKDLEERYNMKSLNHHPTIKPISLMRYLVRLVTKEGQTCLDPFGGSGSTGIACKMEGVNYILFEKDPEYCKIAESRIESHEREEKLNLFEK